MSIKDKISTLVTANNERVQKVDELTNQIENIKAAIAGLKEQHDFTRGQIAALQGVEGESAEPVDKKTKKG